MKNNIKIAIFGAGSIGCYLGGCLAASKAKTLMIGRPRIKTIIEQHGLLLTDWQGRNQKVSPEDLDFSLSPEDLHEANYILVTVKGGDTVSAAKEIAEYAQKDAIVVSFQNGVRNADMLKEYLPEHKILTGMVPFNVINAGEGHFHCGTEGNLALEAQNNIEKPLVEALDKAKLPVITHSDMRSVQWGKLLMNLNNSINALSGKPLLEELHTADYRKVLAASIKEALTVLNAAEIKPARTGKVVPALLPTILSLPNWLFKRIASAMLKIDPEAKSSMAEDLALGRKTEIDYLNGEIANLADKVNASAPINQKIAELIKKAEAEKSGSPSISSEDLKNLVLRPH